MYDLFHRCAYFETFAKCGLAHLFFLRNQFLAAVAIREAIDIFHLQFIRNLPHSPFRFVLPSLHIRTFDKMQTFIPHMTISGPADGCRSRQAAPLHPRNPPPIRVPRRPHAARLIQTIHSAVDNDHLGLALALLTENPLLRLPDDIAEELAAKLRTRGLQSRTDFITGQDRETALKLLAHDHNAPKQGISARVRSLATTGRVHEAFRILTSSSAVNQTTLHQIARAASRAGHLRSALHVLCDLFPTAGLVPSASAFAEFVDSCGRAGKLDRAFESLSADFNNLPLSDQALVYTHLVDACVRCRAVRDANTILQRMRKNGVPRTERIYISLLTAASKNRSVEASLRVLDEMRADGFSIKKVATYNALIVGSARLGRLRDAFRVYDTMVAARVAPNLETYNALLKGCARASQPDRAFEILEKMKKDGNVKPNAISYNFVVVACGRVGDTDRAFQVSKQMQKEGIRLNVVTNNNLLEACCNAGRLERAFIMVKNMIQKQGVRPNSHTYNALIRGCGRWGQLDAALRLLTSMRKAGVSPTVVTYSVAVDACARAGGPTAVDQAFELVDEMQKYGLEPNIVTYNSLIHACARAKRTDMAFQVLNQMKMAGVTPDIVTLCSLVDACGRAGQIDSAFMAIRTLPREFPSLSPNVPAYNALIHACFKAQNINRMHDALQDMQDRSLQPNVVTFSTLISAYAACGEIERATATLRKMREVGIKPNRMTFTSIIAAYGQRGEVDLAMAMLDEAKRSCGEPDEELYTASLVAAVGGGRKELAMKVSKEMDRAGYVVPTILNKIMRKVGDSDRNAEELQGVLDTMEALKIRPQRSAVEGLVAAYAREADVSAASAAVAYMSRLGYPPNLQTYKMLIQACAISGSISDIRKARALFRKLRSAIKGNDPILRSDHWKNLYEALIRALQKAPKSKDGTDLRVSALQAMAKDCGATHAYALAKLVCPDLLHVLPSTSEMTESI